MSALQQARQNAKGCGCKPCQNDIHDGPRNCLFHVTSAAVAPMYRRRIALQAGDRLTLGNGWGRAERKTVCKHERSPGAIAAGRKGRTQHPDSRQGLLHDQARLLHYLNSPGYKHGARTGTDSHLSLCLKGEFPTNLEFALVVKKRRPAGRRFWTQSGSRNPYACRWNVRLITSSCCSRVNLTKFTA